MGVVVGADEASVVAGFRGGFIIAVDDIWKGLGRLRKRDGCVDMTSEEFGRESSERNGSMRAHAKKVARNCQVMER